jgi:hypothetical protein
VACRRVPYLIDMKYACLVIAAALGALLLASMAHAA